MRWLASIAVPLIGGLATAVGRHPTLPSELLLAIVGLIVLWIVRDYGLQKSRKQASDVE